MACAAEPVQLAIVPGKQITGPEEDVPVLISVTPNEGETHVHSDIVAVIDISWSMSMEVKVTSAAGSVESNGLSMLDIAKHAVRTIIGTLGEKDRVAIVQFCRDGEIKLPLTLMNEDGRKLAEQKLDEIQFGNGTSLWNGMDKALTCLTDGGHGGPAKKGEPQRFGHVMVLTDGETEDKAGTVSNLNDYKMKHEKLPGTMSFFGFGYEIDSPLLVQLADYCGGSYAFIPDGGFVGTCFVNAVSNLLTTMSLDATLTLEADNDAEILDVLGGLPWTRNGDTIRVSLNALQYGQSKDVVVRMKMKSQDPYLFACLEASSLQESVRATGLAPGDPKGADSVEPQRCRSIAVGALNKAIEVASVKDSRGEYTEEALGKAREVIKTAIEKIQASSAVKTEQVQGLLEDLLGQSSEALSKGDYWKKWGKHYIPSVASAHKLQQCNNFKDPGVQHYGSEMFSKLRDAADAAFDTLPAPNITPAMYRYLGNGEVIKNPDYRLGRGGGAGFAAAAPPIAANMAAYNDRYAGCIDGNCTATLASGPRRKLAELSKGDRVLAAGSDGDPLTAEIACVVRSRCRGGRALLSELPGKGDAARALRLTPHHPVLADEEGWRFPAELGDLHECPCEAVYTFVLRGAPAILVEGWSCATLGHGLATGAAAHPYFASRQAVEELSQLPGYASGLVDLVPENIIREPETGLVCGLRPAALGAP